MNETVYEFKEKQLFHITCSGASLSSNLKYLAVGDFIGNLKIFECNGI